MEGILSQPLSSYSAREQRLGVKHNQTMTFDANEDSNSQRYLNIETQMNSINNRELQEIFGTQPITATNIISTDRKNTRDI